MILSDQETPFGLARKLVRYHRDPSTVRAMVFREFGRTVGLETIARLRREHEAIRPEGRAPAGPAMSDAIDHDRRAAQVANDRAFVRALQAAGGHR